MELVTLHVSVWVEIVKISFWTTCKAVTLHVSVWVEILCQHSCCNASQVTLHVSVWVEIAIPAQPVWSNMSRSTWACELKFGRTENSIRNRRHAPRERVSWNCPYCGDSANENVTLHVSVWVEIFSFDLSDISSIVTLHVSVWVEILYYMEWHYQTKVTLHVSVWVEIYCQIPYVI